MGLHLLESWHLLISPDLKPYQKPLEIYVQTLLQWQKTLNLVAPSTLEDIWGRHILDSLQLRSLLDKHEVIVDLGSGAGFPGLVLALTGFSRVHLVESDQRKCLFLEEVKRRTHAAATIHCERVEKYTGPLPQTLVARAFAPLAKIFQISNNLITPQTRFVLLKGKRMDTEVKEALKKWVFQVEKHPSLTHTDGQIWVLTEVAARG